MKILKIQFKNINNLKGENTISFVEEPLNSAGIFAITGPTGAGKSTLLDVITLALFNKIPRFKGAISKTSIEGLGSVVTHHMIEAHASITYEIHNSMYTSTWSVGKTRTGKFKDYEMFIYDASGRPLDLKKSEVPWKNEEIIGLKYDQFVKSIILSQGQFSKFLKADKHERGQLLENLTGSTIYRKISMAAYEKYKSVKDEVALEKDRLENIVTLDEEERKQLESQILSNEKEKKELDSALEVLNKEKLIKREIENLSQLLRTKSLEKEQLEKEKSDFKDRLSILETYEKLDTHKVELMKYKEAKQKREKLDSELTSNTQLIKESETSRIKVMSEMGELTNATITADNFRAVMSAFEKEVNGIVQQIQFIGKNGKETRLKINAKAENYQLDLDPKASPGGAITQLEEQVSAKNEAIKKAGFTLEGDLEKMKSKGDQYTKEVEQLNAIKHASDHLLSAKKRVHEVGQEILGYTAKVKEYAPLVKTSQTLVKTAKENVALLKKQKHDALLIAKLSDHRRELIEGEPCPLCGALHHPFADEEFTKDSELQLQIQKAENQLENYEKEYEEYNKQLTSNLSSQQLLENQVVHYHKELDLAEEEIKARKKEYAGKLEIDDENLNKHILKAAQAKEDIESAIHAKQRVTLFMDLIQDFKSLESILNEYTILNSKLKTRYKGQDVSAECNGLQDRFVQLSERIGNLNTLVLEKEKEIESTKLFLNETKAQLSEKLKKIGFQTIDDAVAFIITDSELQQLQLKKKELENWETGLEAEVKSLTSNLEAQQSKDKNPEVGLEEIQHSIQEQTVQKETLIKIIGENTAIIQKDNAEIGRMKSKETLLLKLQQNLNKWSLLNKLIGEKTGNKFANFAQGLTLQNLLVYANKRLQKLSDRYLLDKPIKEGPLTVIDQYQGNIQRSVTTLSGGESFLISLALALSLSDMASKNVNLESLFIDEGFGTLDQESLDIAMNTLEKLQTESQKTVGVISHVEALKERIHVQVKLAKNAQGYGTIKIEG